MANREHVVVLNQGVDAWNRWRQHIGVERPDLRDLDLSKRDLHGIDFHKVDLYRGSLWKANLAGANLESADLSSVTMNGTNLVGATLRAANLRFARLVGADVTDAVFSECHLYGCSVWNLHGRPREQVNVIITPPGELAITVDDIEIGQFIFLLLNNQRIRSVVDSISSKVVLILGRFTPERKAILDAIRKELRSRDYSPVLFDFEKPSNRDITETVSTLAHMARFVVADITDAKSIPQELMRIVPALPSVPVQPLLLSSQREYGMFEHFRRFPWVLEPFLYEDQDQLLRSLDSHVIGPAEGKAKEQTGR